MSFRLPHITNFCMLSLMYTLIIISIYVKRLINHVQISLNELSYMLLRCLVSMIICPRESSYLPWTSGFIARPADGKHCPASSLKASGIQPANPLPTAGSGLWWACSAIHCQWSSEECGGQVQCITAHHTESSGNKSLGKVSHLHLQVITDHWVLWYFVYLYLFVVLGYVMKKYLKWRGQYTAMESVILDRERSFVSMSTSWSLCSKTSVKHHQLPGPFQSLQHAFRIFQQVSWKCRLINSFY